MNNTLISLKKILSWYYWWTYNIKDDFTRNISDIYFNRQSKTQENNNKSKNMIFKGVNQNLLKENTNFIFIRNNNSNINNSNKIRKKILKLWVK